mgnify:CR=1 FL=1
MNIEKLYKKVKSASYPVHKKQYNQCFEKYGYARYGYSKIGAYRIRIRTSVFGIFSASPGVTKHIFSKLFNAQDPEKYDTASETFIN